MDFLRISGKRFLIFGVANKKSVAFAVASMLRGEQASCVFVVRDEPTRERAAKLFPDADFAARAFDALFQRGLIVREIGASYGIPNGLRISIGPEDAMRRLVDVLADFGERA